MRGKEFLSKNNIEFEPINVAYNPEGQARLHAHGLDHVPFACVGDKCVSGSDLRGIAELIGFQYDSPPILPPAELYTKWVNVLAGAVRYVRQVPFEALAYASPDRDRNLRQLAIHAIERPILFISVYDTGETVPSTYRTRATPETTSEDIALFGEQTIATLEKWWTEVGVYDPMDRVIEVGWGFRTLQEVMERDCWHSAQHTRQILYFLETLGITPDGALTPADWEGLPVPEHVWH